MTINAAVIGDLNPLSWNSLVAPCALAPYEVKHNLAERKYPYVDGAAHDDTGRDPVQLNARLYFINTVEPGSYPDNFTRWRDALIVGTIGELEHPDLGKIDARVVSFHVDLTAENRGGVVVDVVFTESIRDPDVIATFFGSPDVDSLTAAEAADAALAAVGISYPDGTGDSSLFDAIASVKGQLFSASLTVGGKIDQVLGTVEGLVDDVRALNDPSAWPAATNLTILYASLTALKATAAKVVARATGKVTLTTETTLDAFAAAHGNTVDEIVGLNLSALGAPVVSVGTTLAFYK